MFQDVAGAVGRVIIDRRLLSICRRLVCRAGVGEIGDQVGDRLDITGVARGDRDAVMISLSGSIAA
jgi:hypothetical protein